MNNYLVKLRKHGGRVPRVIEVDMKEESTEDIWTMVDHWNENSDSFYFEILEITEETK